MTVRGSRKDAEKELRRLPRSLDTGEHVDPTRITVREWLATWLVAVLEEVSPKTHERYAEIVNHFLTPALGNLPSPSWRPHIYRKPTPRSLSAAGATGNPAGYRRGPAGIFTAS